MLHELSAAQALTTASTTAGRKPELSARKNEDDEQAEVEGEKKGL